MEKDFKLIKYKKIVLLVVGNLNYYLSVSYCKIDFKNTKIIMMCLKVCENDRIICNMCSYLYLM